MSSTRAAADELTPHHRRPRRRAQSAGHRPARSCSARAEAPILTTQALGRSDREGHRQAAAAGPHPSGDPHLPGLAHPCEPRARGTRRGTVRRRNGCSSPAADWRSSPSIRSKTASSSASSSSACGQAAGGRRAICRTREPDRSELHAAVQGPSRSRAKRRSRANPRARSAKLRAGERTEAPPMPLDADALACRKSKGAPLMLRALQCLSGARACSVSAFVLYSLEHSIRGTERADRAAQAADRR